MLDPVWQIPLSDIDLDEAEIEAVEKVLRSRWLSMGEVTARFEKSYAKFLDCSFALAVTNGTAALHLACLALGLGPGDEVILPSLTFVATANAVLYTGATPVFADIASLDDLTIDPAAIQARITSRTRAIMVMHYGGYLCDMTEIQRIARQHGLAIIEDAAHAPGSATDNQQAGTFGDIGCFSFFANKNLVTGEGGLISTNRADLAEKLRWLRSHGMTSLTWDRHHGHAQSYDVIGLGYNYRIDELRAAIGLAQLDKLSQNNRRRQDIARQFRIAFEKHPALKVPFSQQRGVSASHLFTIMLDNPALRVSFITHLRSQGIQTSLHYPPIHQFTYHKQHLKDPSRNLPITEMASSRLVTLPMFPTMTNQQIHLLIDTVNRYSP